MLRENSRGVVYHNPLFSGMNKGDSAKPGFGFRQLLRRYKKATFLVATISFAIVFVVLPHLSLGGDSFHESGFPLTTTKLLLLVFTGVFQHYLVLFLLFAPGDNVSRALRQCNKLLLFVFVVWVSFGPGEQLTDSTQTEKQHKMLGIGNCSLLNDIPEQFFDLNAPIEGNQLYIYKYKAEFYPIAYEKTSMILNLLETVYPLLMRSTGRPMTDECEKVTSSYALLMLFRPCGQYCQEAQYLCNSSCSNPCFKDTLEAAFGHDSTFSEISEIAADYWTDRYGSIINGYLNGAWPESTELDRTKFSEQFLSLFWERVKEQAELYKNNSLCKPISALDNRESCFALNGEVYSSSTNKDHRIGEELSCNKTDQNGQINRGSSPRQQQTQNSGVAFLWISTVTFYANALWSIVTWYRLSQTYPANRNEYPLGSCKKISLVGMGLIGYMFSAATIHMIIMIEGEHDPQTGEPTIQLQCVYMFLCVPVILCASIATTTVATSIQGTGQSIKNKKHSAKKSRSLMLVNFTRIVAMYQQQTSPRNGPWFLTKIIFWECFEVCIQFTSLHLQSRNHTLSYVLVISCLLWINMMVTTAIFYRKLFDANAKMWKNAEILGVDTVIDTLYFATNVYFLTGKDLYSDKVPFVTSVVGSLSIAWPVLCVVLRIRSVARLIVLKIGENAAPNLSFHGHKERSKTGKRYSVLWSVMWVVTVSFSAQFVFLLIGAVQLNAHCSNELGEALWSGAHPKHTFVNGLYGEQDCNFRAITHIVAPEKGIKSISPSIGKCTSIIALDLKHNAISDLPRELILMESIGSVELLGNPVSLVLNASNMALGRGVGNYDIPAFIQQHLSRTIKVLDLSNNQISKIGDSVSKFKHLQTLILSNNNLKPDRLSWRIVNLHGVLDRFLFEGNPVSTYLDWSNQGGFKRGYKNGERSMRNAVAFLSVFFAPSIRSLNLSNNDFTKPMVEDMLYDLTGLQSLDLSMNKQIKSGPAAPLRFNLSERLVDLQFLNLTHCKRIQGIDLDDLVEMERRLLYDNGRFYLKGVGIISFVSMIPGHARVSKAMFPTHILSQVSGLVQIKLENTHFQNFSSGQLCNFVELVFFSYDFYGDHIAPEQSWDFPPPCALPSLEQFYMSEANVNFYSNRSFPSLKEFAVSSKYGSVERTFPKIPYSVARQLRTSSDFLELHQFKPLNNAKFPPVYSSWPSLRLAAMNLEDYENSLSIPPEWKTFEYFEVGVSPKPEYSKIVGSAAQLHIKKGADIKMTNLSGPLFTLSPGFNCFLVNAPYDKNETVAWRLFEKKWNISCSELPKEVCSDDECRKMISFDEHEFVVQKVVNCSLPTVGNSTFSNVVCIGTHQPTISETLNIWRCYERDYFQLRRSCTLANALLY